MLRACIRASFYPEGSPFMLELEELRLRLFSLKPQIDDLADALGIEKIKGELSKIEEQTAENGFWDDVETSQQVLKRQSRMKATLEDYQRLENAYDDAMTLVEVAMEGDDQELYQEALAGTDKLESEMDALRLSTLLTGEYDANNAILTFHAGAGGTEAQDWCQMLYRMYTRWAERHNFKYTLVDWLDGEEAGLKSATVMVEGENAYGFLRSENGVHRLVRISPFDASGRRHTSFASLEVMPEISDDNTIEINEEDIKMEVYRASGAGGQKVNKTSSAVRLIHIPTGIVVCSQIERSQYQNRAVCMQMLKSKLIEIKEREHLEKIEDIKGVQQQIAWGSQIRSYVFMPYTLAKDHRTGYEMGNISDVMDGDIDGFINAYLKQMSRGKFEGADDGDLE